MSLKGKRFNWSILGFDLIKIMITFFVVFIILWIFKLFHESFYGLMIGSMSLTCMSIYHYVTELKNKNIHILNYLFRIIFIMIFFNLAFSLIYMNAPEGSYLEHKDKPLETNFETATYFSYVTFMTLGYGDIVPVGILRFVAIVQAIFGWITLGVLILGITKYAEG